MVQIAADADVKSTRVSFTVAINLIDIQLRWLALSPDGTLPAKLKQRPSATLFCQIKERTERFHVQSCLCHPSIRLGISDDAYSNDIKS
ncbi:hypothetical protein AYY21_11620 [Photobacterium aquimaris]|nr:hypothetical protein AYY21_11620 [Photobacterium aquimaris]